MAKPGGPPLSPADPPEAHRCVHCGETVGGDFLCWNCNRPSRHFTETTEQEMYDEVRAMMLEREARVWRANRTAAFAATGAAIALSLAALVMTWGWFAIAAPLALALLLGRAGQRAARRLERIQKKGGDDRKPTHRND